MQQEDTKQDRGIDPCYDWTRVASLILTSRAMDEIEETRLVPERKVLYQFSARGHDLAQVLLGTLLNHPHDGVGAYYRSRPLLLALGLTSEDGFAGSMARSGGFSNGRDIGVVCNLPSRGGATVLPMAGDVGSQFTPAAGWAQSIVYHQEQLGSDAHAGAIAAVLAGDAACATNGFWSALTIATTQKLPMLFFIEDNAYGISVPSSFQTPGENIAANLASFSGLEVFDGDGADPADAAHLICSAVKRVRSGRKPVLLRLRVPRLCGHSGQDTQAYKDASFIDLEKKSDPLPRLREYLVPAMFSEREWKVLEEETRNEVEESLRKAQARPEPDPSAVSRHVFLENGPDDRPEYQELGGLVPSGWTFPESSTCPNPEPTRINMLTAIRRTLEYELRTNPRVLIFGEDVGPKGGVHAATMGLQSEFGDRRVFDTSLSEEGIIGRAVGMALAGLMPVPEIQFRKYADPATEHLNNCGTIRWRTANRMAAPMVVRMPGGFAKCGDPWHSVSGEVVWAHQPGWQVAFPSNAEDAVGLLRAAMRSSNPTIFFEHRHLYDAPWARRPYPGDAFLLPFGKAKITQTGTKLTVVTWGAMVERCEKAAQNVSDQIEIIDLRTIVPWDSETVLQSLAKTKRCMIVHEDGKTAGFGAEIAATLTSEAFFDLDAPIERLCVPDIPIPYNVELMASTLPSVEGIAEMMNSQLEF